jgi:hypothetical protein
MKVSLLRSLFILALVWVTVPFPGLAQTANDEPKVLATIQDFLNAMRVKDSARMASHIDSTTRFTLLRPTPGGTRVWVVSGSEFIKLVVKPEGPSYDEPVRNPVVQINGDLASVWAEYQVILNGAVSHCGFDAVHLARVNGEWKIINLSDTFRRDGCGAMWRPTPSAP